MPQDEWVSYRVGQMECTVVQQSGYWRHFLWQAMQGASAGEACRERVQHGQRNPESSERERSYLKPPGVSRGEESQGVRRGQV